MSSVFSSILNFTDQNRESIIKALDNLAMFVILDESWNIMEASDAFNRLISSHPANKPQMNALFRKLGEKPEVHYTLGSNHSTPQTWAESFHFQTGKGTCFWFELSVSNLPDPGHSKARYLAVIKDISSLKEALKIKEQFLSNMSHELRTPLHSLISLTNLLGDTLLDHEQNFYVNTLKSSCEVLHKMVENLLDINQLETGRITLEKITFSFHHLIENVCNIFKIKAEEKGLEILSFNDFSIPDYLVGDSLRLKQVLLHLLENAVKFTEAGSITITTRLVKKNPRFVEVEFSISDTGIGIPADKLEQMFEKFNQARIQDDRSFGGPGLGLTIAKQLIELQGGNIALKSAEKKGTEVTFKIRYSLGQSAQMQLPTSERMKSVTPTNTLQDMKVLIAEDVDINRLVIGKHMQKFGYQYDFAENGKIAVDKVRENHYDIILMDMQMPVMDGYEAIRIIRNELEPSKSGIPIISVTASVLGDASQKCKEAGANDYVPKPYNVADLQKKMETLVAGNSQKTSTAMETNPNFTQQLINLDYLEQMADGDNEFIESMITYFITNAPISIEDMKKSMTEENWETLRHVAHKFKPQLNFMGIQSILQEVETIEQNAHKVVNTQDIPPMLEKVEKIAFLAIEMLKAELNKRAQA